MGRRPNASKLKEKTHMLTQQPLSSFVPESTDPNVLRVELEPKNNDPSSGVISVQHESSKLAADSSLERVESQLKMQSNFSKSLKKVARKSPAANVRRSERLQTAVMVPRSQDIEHVIEEITLSDSEKEDEPGDEKLLEPSVVKKDLEGKIDRILKILEAHQETIDALKSKPTSKTLYNDSSSGAGEITYKSLYIDAQKKVEALMEENFQLNLKLENACGKIEAYEKGNPMVCEVLDKFNAILFSRLPKFTEAAVNVSTEATHGVFTAPDPGLEHRTNAKRKKLDK